MNPRPSDPAAPRTRHRTAWWAAAWAAGMALAGLLATGLAVQSAREQARADATTRFERQVEQIRADAARRLSLPAYGLMGARGMLAALPTLNRAQFEAYVRSRDLPREFPGVAAFGWIERVPRHSLAAWTASVRADGAPDFSVGAPGSAEALHVVKHVGPLPENRLALGLDLGKHPQLHESLERAVREGTVTLSAPVELALRPGALSYLLFLPVYTTGADLSTAQARVQALRGVLFAQLLVRELLAPVAGMAGAALDYEVFDGAAGLSTIVYDHDGHLGTLPQSPASAAASAAAYPGRRFVAERRIEVANRQLTLRISALEGFDEASLVAWLVALAGGAATALVVLLTLRLARGRLRAEDRAAALGEQVQRLATVAEHTSNVVLIVDAEHRITWVNGGFERVTGYTLQEALGQRPAELLRADDENEPAERAVQQAIAEAQPHWGVFRGRHKDGRLWWVQLELQPLRDAEGRHAGYVEIGTDITAEREAASALEAQRARLEALLAERMAAEQRWRARAELSGDWFWLTDTEHRFVDLADGAMRSAQLPWQRLTGRRRDEVASLEPPAEGWAAFHARLDRHEPFHSISYRSTLDKGRVQWIEIDGRPRFDGHGVFLGYEGVARDITERRADTERLRESLALVDALFEAIPMPVLLKDHEGRYTKLNKAHAAMMGWSARALIGLRSADVTEPEIAARHLAVDTELLRSPGERSYTLRQRVAGGRLVDTLIHKASLVNADGKVTGIVAVTVDMTEQQDLVRATQAAREAAEAANRAKSAFLAAMSHEIRTPMNGVLGMSELLAHTRLDEDQQRSVQTITQSAAALLRILDDILDFSKIEAGRLELEPRELTLRAMAGEVCDALAPMAADKSVTLTWQVADDVPRVVRADATRLRQVLNNLLGNAIKFSAAPDAEAPPGPASRRGTVTLAVHATDAGLRFEVADNGIGMDEATQQRLFEPFMQAEASTTRRFGGTGLGLAITRRLVHLMGGTIEVHSRLGEGTRMAVTLPLPAALDAPAPAAPTASVATMPSAGRPILVAEDDPVNRIVIQRQLKLLGHHAEIVEDGEQALRRWREAGEGEDGFALLLSDLHMPRLDGYDLATAIRHDEAQRPGAARRPLLALTANALKGEEQRAFAAGMDAYLTKPIRLQALREALARHLPSTVTKPLPQAPAVPAEPDPDSAPLTFDAQALPRLVGSDPAVLGELLDEFLQGSATRVAQLVTLCDAGDAAAVPLAHRLRSSALAVGAQALAEACRDIELALGSSASATQRRSCAARLEQRWHAVRPLLEAERPGAGAAGS